jgi:hypothetical protein
MEYLQEYLYSIYIWPCPKKPELVLSHPWNYERNGYLMRLSNPTQYGDITIVEVWHSGDYCISLGFEVRDYKGDTDLATAKCVKILASVNMNTNEHDGGRFTTHHVESAISLWNYIRTNYDISSEVIGYVNDKWSVVLEHYKS